MAGEEVFDLEADLLLYRVTLVELARTFKGDAGLGQLVQLALRAHARTACGGRQKSRNGAGAIRGHRLREPLLGERKVALLEGFDSGQDSCCRPLGRRLPVGREPRHLGLLQCLYKPCGVETLASLRPKHEAAEQPIDFPQGLARSGLAPRAAAGPGPVSSRAR